MQTMKVATVLGAASLLALSSCEHKSKKDDDKAAAAAKPAAPAVPAPPSGEANPPTPTPAAAGDLDALRPPVAADLKAYLADLPGSGPLTATIETTMGVLHCELFADKAPMTVANFVGLATGKKPYQRDGQVVKGKPYFDGLTFHRVIPGFMIQGGDPEGRGTGGPGYQFGQEIAPDLHHEPGVLSMANAGPGTNGSQFFVMEGAKPDLDGGYNIFGKCKEVDVVKAITNVARGPRDKPDVPVVMNKVTISRS